MKNIYFVVKNINCGSSLLRAFQIKDKLKKKYKNIEIIDKNEVNKLYNITHSIIFWIVPIIHLHYMRIKKTNKHILDVIDNYIYHKDLVLKSIFCSNSIIVNSKYMLTYFKSKYKYKNNIYIIYHHWDQRLNLTKTVTSNKLVFGYMGSIKSLLHSNNFLHYNELKNKYNIKFYDTEIGKDVTEFVMNNDYSFKKSGVFNTNNIPKTVHFNCDMNIREYNTNISKFKTTAKIATAAGLGHNIITTIDMAVVDILPDNYPFILRNTNLNSVISMIELVKRDYHGTKELWNKGLEIMKKVKDKLNIENIILNYIKVIEL